MAKKSVDLTVVVVVSFIVAVLASLLTLAMAGNYITGQFFKPSTQVSASNQIRAHSCDADATCEVNSLSSSGTLQLSASDAQSSLSPYGLESGDSDSFFVARPGRLSMHRDGGQSLLYLTPLEGVTLNSTVSEMGITMLNYNQDTAFIKPSSVSFSYLGGATNASVCVDPDGKFFRSQTPCV